MDSKQTKAIADFLIADFESEVQQPWWLSRRSFWCCIIKGRWTTHSQSTGCTSPSR
jgi:hypothetical protein